jgi:hypothetical protein
MQMSDTLAVGTHQTSYSSQVDRACDILSLVTPMVISALCRAYACAFSGTVEMHEFWFSAQRDEPVRSARHFVGLAHAAWRNLFGLGRVHFSAVGVRTCSALTPPDEYSVAVSSGAHPQMVLLRSDAGYRHLVW